jgi:preprotein translocase subunit SecG
MKTSLWHNDWHLVFKMYSRFSSQIFHESMPIDMPILLVTLQGIQVVSAIILIALVLLHSPKGDGFAGLGGAGQLFSSQKGAEAALTKTTAVIAGAFFLSSFVLGYYF